jgi:hypothetical protein
MPSLIAITIALSLAGWGLLFYLAAVRTRQEAHARVSQAELAAKDADARTDKAIELWNDERAEHTRDQERARAEFDVVTEQARTTVAQYRHAFDKLALRLRESTDADPDDETPPTRVM